MYLEVGAFSDSDKLSDLAPLLNPKPCEHGYCTTDKERTQEVYYPHLKDTFPGKWVACRLAIIWPHGSIYPHCDGNVGHRYFAVLKVNDRCWNLHDGTWQQLEQGKIYSVDGTKEHASINWGQEPRINFVIDLQEELNDYRT